MMKRILVSLLALCLVFGLMPAFAAEDTITVYAAEHPVTEDGWYHSMEDVAVYLATFDKLPGNFLRKREAEALGWESREGNLGEVAPDCAIGGDRFGNYEGILPDASGRSWTECDIDFDGSYRNGQRVVFSNDGLIYYTDDHYNTFRLIEIVWGDAPAPASADVVYGDDYTSRDDVAAYLNAFGELPPNYVTRNEYKQLSNSEKKIFLVGGDSFGNREGLLPAKSGRKWYECDVNISGGKRSDERLVYSSDGLIYYTPDSHKTFEQLY